MTGPAGECNECLVFMDDGFTSKGSISKDCPRSLTGPALIALNFLEVYVPEQEESIWTVHVLVLHEICLVTALPRHAQTHFLNF